MINFQNADTRPRLQSRTQNICFVISISAVILKRMVTSTFGSNSFLRIALHDTFSLSHHLLTSWNLYISRVAESKRKCSSSRPGVKPDEKMNICSSTPQHRGYTNSSLLEGDVKVRKCHAMLFLRNCMSRKRM